MGTTLHWISQSGWAMAWLPLLLDAAVKGLLVLVLAGALSLLLRRASAASRHLLWCVALVQVMAMPLLSLTLPAWRIPLLPSGLAAVSRHGASVISESGPRTPALALPSGPSRVTPRADTPSVEAATPPASLVSPTAAGAAAVAPVGAASVPLQGLAWALLLWTTGLALAVAPVLFGLLSLHRIGRRVRPLTDPSWTALLQRLAAELGLRRRVRLCQTEQVSVPMTWGLWRPTILLPADAQSWTEERRRLVLLHELAHIQRADCLTQTLAQLACALYWFNPLTWLAARQLRVERERACDDRVLAAGARASDYAQHLLEIARQARGASCASLAAVAMARPSQLEGRLLAVLDGERSRRAVSRLAALVAVVAGCGAVLPLAALEAAARPGSTARAKTAAPRRPVGQMALRQVWAGPGAGCPAALSANGRHVAYTQRDFFGIRDLTTGKSHRFRNVDYDGVYNEVISPDGRQVAYTWYSAGGAALHLISRDNPNPRVLAGAADIRPAAWSPDGKRILGIFARNKIHEIVLVSVSDGSVRVLKSLDWRYPLKVSFSPDGRSIVYDFPPSESTANRDIYLLDTDTRRERPLVQHPANDIQPLWTPDGKGVLFSSDRAGTLGVWITRVPAGEPPGSPELVKNHLGPINPIGFAPNGSLYYGILEGRENVYTVTFDPGSGAILAPPSSTSPRYIGDNTRPAWSPDGRSLAYLTYGSWVVDPTIIVSIRSLATGGVREIPPKLIFMANLGWSPDARFLFATGKDPKEHQNAFRIDAQTGETTVFPGRGVYMRLATWSPDGQKLYYAAGPGDGLWARDLVTGEEKELYRGRPPGREVRMSDGRPRGAFFSSVAVSPDGRQLAFSEAQDASMRSWVLKAMPAAGGEPRELCQMKQPGWIGLNTLAWSGDGRHILFGWRPKEITELWRVPAPGGEPQRLKVAMENMRHVRVHPNGRQIAFTAGRPTAEVWVMENFLPASQTARASAPQR
jgi:Tol biopolymer transport system component/beta-lactamase regulating signal transducer with metallopeptidase domain